MEEEKKVSEETKVKMPEANPYSKVRETDDAETEAFRLEIAGLRICFGLPCGSHMLRLLL